MSLDLVTKVCRVKGLCGTKRCSSCNQSGRCSCMASKQDDYEVHSSKISFSFQCCFTSTEIVRTVRDGEPRTATSIFTQLLNSDGDKFNVALRPQSWAVR